MKSMAKIRTVVFWFGGVLTVAIPEVMTRILFNAPIEKVDMPVRLRIRHLTTDLILGHMSTSEYCSVMIEENGQTMTPDKLESEVKERLQLHTDVLDVIRELPPEVERWLLCDYPRSWYEPAQQRNEPMACIPREHILFTSEAQLPRLVPDVFFHLSRCSEYPVGSCLIFDADMARAIQALRHGLHAAIFVDQHSFRREFVLRHILSAPRGFVYPGPANT